MDFSEALPDFSSLILMKLTTSIHKKKSYLSPLIGNMCHKDLS